MKWNEKKAGLQESESGSDCYPVPLVNILHIPCCFATVTPGAICNQNRQLVGYEDAQLTSDHIKTQLYANITLLLNEKFNITVRYYQPYFPIYFGQLVM